MIVEKVDVPVVGRGASVNFALISESKSSKGDVAGINGLLYADIDGFAPNPPPIPNPVVAVPVVAAVPPPNIGFAPVPAVPAPAYTPVCYPAVVG